MAMQETERMGRRRFLRLAVRVGIPAAELVASRVIAGRQNSNIASEVGQRMLVSGLEASGVLTALTGNPLNSVAMGGVIGVADAAGEAANHVHVDIKFGADVQVK